MTVPLLVLGTGWLGRRLLSAVPGAVGTTRDGRDGTLRFSLGDDPSILPAAHTVAWTLALQDTEHALALHGALRARQHLVMGTSGAFPDGDAPFLDESSPLDTSPRTRAEEALRARGAEVFRLAGLWGWGRHPWDWVASGRISDGNRMVNLVHGTDVLATVLRAMEHPLPGRHLLVADGHPHRWHDLVAAFASDGRLPAGARLPDGPGNARRLRNTELRRFMGSHVFAVPRLTVPASFGAALEEARHQHATLASLLSHGPESLALDRASQDAASHALEQVLESLLEAAADVARTTVTAAPTTLVDAFAIVHAHGLVPRGGLDALLRLARLRRAGAEGYTGVDVESFHAGTADALPVLCALLDALSAWPGRVVTT